MDEVLKQEMEYRAKHAKPVASLSGIRFLSERDVVELRKAKTEYYTDNLHELSILVIPILERHSMKTESTIIC
jgi:hypothetical protein